jgi:hypothetical protein
MIRTFRPVPRATARIRPSMVFDPSWIEALSRPMRVLNPPAKMQISQSVGFALLGFIGMKAEYVKPPQTVEQSELITDD